MRCITCGKEFRCKPSEVKRGRKYCSTSCRSSAIGVVNLGIGERVMSVIGADSGFAVKNGVEERVIGNEKGVIGLDSGVVGEDSGDEVFEKHGKPPLCDLPSWVDTDLVLREVGKRGRAIIRDEAETPIGEVGRDLVYKEY